MKLLKIIVPIIIIVIVLGIFVINKADEGKICTTEYAPVLAKNIFTQEEKKFPNGCEVSFWWRITDRHPYVISETL